MALFNNKETFKYEILREGEEIVLRVEMEDYPKIPSIEDDPIAMSRIVDIVVEAGAVTKIVCYQKRDYEYDYH